MKYFYIELMLLAIRLFDFIPKFLLKFFLFSSNHKFQKYAPHMDAKDNNSKKILIWMDYSNAIGDFFIILKSVVKLNEIGVKVSILVHDKFRGVVEQLNLQNIEIIYKKNSLGKHYLKQNGNLFINMDKITEEFEQKNLVFDKIYYFNGILLSDALTAIKCISYNELVMIDPIIFLRGRNSKFVDRNFVSLSLFYLLHSHMFKISIISKNYKSYSLNDMIDDLFNTKNIKSNRTKYMPRNYSLIAAGASNATKVLKQDLLLEIINKYVKTSKNIFVGSDFDKEFIKNIIDNNDDKFIFEFNMKLINLFKLVKYSDLVITYDTGLYHIARFLNVETCLIINQKDFAYKYMRSYWLGDTKTNDHRIILKRRLFYK